jgi:hypothetical protein
MAQVETSMAGTDIRPFRINVPERSWRTFGAASRRRGAPDRETVSDRSQGVHMKKLQGLVRHWVPTTAIGGSRRS